MKYSGSTDSITEISSIPNMYFFLLQIILLLESKRGDYLLPFPFFIFYFYIWKDRENLGTRMGLFSKRIRFHPSKFTINSSLPLIGGTKWAFFSPKCSGVSSVPRIFVQSSRKKWPANITYLRLPVYLFI